MQYSSHDRIGICGIRSDEGSGDEIRAGGREWHEGEKYEQLHMLREERKKTEMREVMFFQDCSANHSGSVFVRQ